MKLSEVKTMEEYKNLPKSERESFGFYKDPPNLDFWEYLDFCDFMVKKYPIQDFFRNRIPYYFRIRTLRSLWHRLQNLIDNPHGDIRRQIPRQWKDLTATIEDVNFEIIKAFHHEAKNSCIDWASDPNHVEFYDWLQDSFLKIMVEIPAIEENLYRNPQSPDYWAWNKELEEMKTKILTKMVEYRGYFWT